MKTRIITIMLISSLLLASQLLSQPPQGRPMPGDNPRMYPELNLTTEQLNTFNEMQLKFQKEMLPLENEIAAKRLELESLIISTKPDQDKINAVIEELGTLRTKAQKKQVAHRLAMRDQLTEEQKAIWDAIPQGPQMHGKRDERMEFGDPFGPPGMHKQGGRYHQNYRW
jgi:Spy/CpxP family protein refolding chaperone